MEFERFWRDLTALVGAGLTIQTAGRTGKPNVYRLEAGVIHVTAEGGGDRVLPKASFARCLKALQETGKLDRHSGITAHSSAIFALVAQLPYVYLATQSPMVLKMLKEV